MPAHDTLLTNAAAALAEYEAVLADANTATDERDAALATIADLHVEIDRLQAIIDGTTEPPPPPPPGHTMYVGAASGDDLEKLIGERLGMYRRYDGNDVDAATIRSFAAADKGRMRAWSFKGNPAALTSALLDLVPNDGFPTVMIFDNEWWGWDINGSGGLGKPGAEV